jgi:hypothetical protein
MNPEREKNKLTITAKSLLVIQLRRSGLYTKLNKTIN